MGRKSCLNVEEIAKIDVLHSEGYSNRKIALKIYRSSCVVDNYLKNTANYGRNFKGNVVSKISPADRRRILRCASNTKKTIRQIGQECDLAVSKSTLHRVISKCDHLRLQKLQKKPPLDAGRRQKRLEFGEKYMAWSIDNTIRNDWKLVVFTDEKRFNLDGPDGYNYYFHDLRKEEVFLQRNHSRVGGVMVWGAISFYGKIDLVFIEGKMTGISYKNMLDEALTKFEDVFGTMSWIFQQDNPYTARVVKNFFNEKNIELLDWPPYSPDLNIIENVWGWMTRKLYEGRRQFVNKDSLIRAIKEVWEQIPVNYIENLYRSLPKRLFEVIAKNGGHTHY